ncbi:hypothetical protein TRFO_32483 [Tritrichomonas foetus]|uniref:Importin N-terminal domain-containing protein n=1 Tax=Tritrichomonas foetus TaxID=1144522 RepID=A0A1J4JT94_9EUKA|nr:hypothetical protein TRFO_32483 [Tritrichomonas foetus]|eukprot:OHT00716.1 hypothetical protein TRFO_32483 [Tritrichomonas foetus]
MDTNQHLITLFTELSNPMSQNIAVVTQELEAFLNNPQSIFSFIAIAATDKSPQIRHTALIFCRRYFSIVSELADKSGCPDYSSLKIQLLEMITKEPIIQLKFAIIDVLELFGSIIIEFSTWPELAEFGMALLNDPGQLYVGLHFMNCAYDLIQIQNESGNDNGEDEIPPNPLLAPYATILVNSILSTSLEIRMEAINCLSDLIFELQEDDDILQIPNLMEALKIASERAVFQYQNPDECARLFGSLKGIFFDRFDQFLDFAPTFCEFALKVATNSQFPLNIRMHCQQILDDAPNQLSSYFQDHLLDYVQAVISLSVEICTLERDMTDYQFCEEFLSNLSSNSENPDELYELIMQCVGSLCQSNNPPSLQVAFFILSCIVPSCSDAILDSPDVIINLTLTGLQSNDGFVASASNELLMALSEDASSCLSNHLDTFVEILSNKLNDSQFLMTLEALLSFADRQTIHLQKLLALLLGMLGGPFEFKSGIIKCIGSALDHADLNESLYSVIAPPLIGLMQSDSSLIGDIFSCFGSVLNVAPISLANDLNTFMQFMFTAGTTQLSRTQALLDFVETLPVSMAPFTQQVVEFCHAIFSLPLETGSEEETELLDAREPAIQILAYLAPDAKFVELLSHMIHSIYCREQSSASIALVTAAPSLKLAKFDIAPVLMALFEELFRIEYPNIACEMINAITAIISAYPPNYVIENANSFAILIDKALKSEFEFFKIGDLKQSADVSFMPSIMSLFEHFIDIVGTNFSQLLPMFQEKLIKLANGKVRNFRGYAILMLSHIAITLQSSDIMQIALSAISGNIRLKHVYLRTNLFNAIRIILRGNPEIFAPHQQLIQEILMQILQNVASGSSENKELFESAVALWCRCILAFHWQTAPNDVVSILSKVDTLFQNDNGKCYEYAELLSMYAENSWTEIAETAIKIAIRIFAQKEWNFLKTPQNVLDFAKKVFMQHQNLVETIQVRVGFNQRIQKTIMDRLQG